MTRDLPDPIRFLINAMEAIAADGASTLWSRGWAAVNPQATDDEAIEWFWPPTAPVGFTGLTEHTPDAAHTRPGMLPDHQTPWTTPTVLTRSGDGWLLRHGTTAALPPTPDRVFDTTPAMVSELDAIEWWPMPLAEVQRVRSERLMTTITAIARDDHYEAVPITQPYADRIDAAREPTGPRSQRDAQFYLIDADAWASHLRTMQAGVHPGLAVRVDEEPTTPPEPV